VRGCCDSGGEHRGYRSRGRHYELGHQELRRVQSPVTASTVATAIRGHSEECPLFLTEQCHHGMVAFGLQGEEYMSSRRILSVMLLAAWVVLSCTSPVPMPTASSLASPVGLDEESPLDPATLPQGPLFTISLPLKAGDLVAQGTGEAGVPLRVVNVTQMASTLGQGTIGPDGKFEIRLAQPLVQGDRIGLMIGDLTGTRFQPTDFLSGPGYWDMPYIGVVFTSTLVTQ